MKQIYEGYTLVTDLDGTMLYPIAKWRIVPPKTEAFLKRFTAGGGRLVLCTGRDLHFTEKVARIAGVPADFIATNGTVIKTGGKIIHNEYIPRHTIEELERKTLQIAPEVVFCLRHTGKRAHLVLNKQNKTEVRKFGSMYAKKFGRSANFSDLSPKNYQRALDYTNEIVLCLLDAVKVKKIHKLLNTEFADRLKSDIGTVFEINPFGQSKATGIRQLVDLYGLDTNKLYIAGDDVNDRAMFEAFNKNSFCIRHSRNADVQQLARYVVDEFCDIEQFLQGTAKTMNNE
ncbi:MAG: Cof-type HAD-IIB family hydrolase [Firmicutes bacterium]|nr:Cof-type HAD-IIB family hydrolase [Bacillota bacterium]